VTWGYDGPGAPEHWASLSGEYATCADGRQQSPIDIISYDLGDAASMSFSYDSNAKAVRNDGRFVHVDYGPGNTLSIGQRIYRLKSAHFHSPSEHRIDGANFAAELHLVHADSKGNLAVVGLLFEAGPPSPVVEEILDTTPTAGGTVVDGFTLNADGYLPGELGYYRYDGSKTTPPCDEPVDWYVMRQTMSISPEQVDGLQALSGGPNNRPVQPIGNRLIPTR
jgi:carbonic anhydrase